MNDTTIINTISRIYFIIVSFFVFIFLILSTSFIILQNGLAIDKISLPNIKIEQLYINWNEKIDISIKNIVVHSRKNKKELELNPESLHKYISFLSQYNHIFSSIALEKITVDKVSASLRYKEGQKGFFRVSSPRFNLDSEITTNQNSLNLHILNLQSLTNHIQINGDLYFDSKSLDLFSKLNININNDINISLFLELKKNILIYKLKNNNKIKSIKYLIDIIHLPKEVKFWVLDAIDMKYLSIEKAKGFIDFKDTKSALKNLHVLATVHGLNYIYNKKLDAVHTKITYLEFKEGVLYIRPKNAYSYGMYLDKSWLKIDFNPKEELLTLYLLFDGMLNKDMLKVLNAYKIKLPYLQKSGKVKTNLRISVGLRNINIEAKGNFFAKKALFYYLGLNLNVRNAYIKLNNYDVDIKDMIVSYKKFAISRVDANYNASTEKGTINFQINKINLPKEKLSLLNVPLKIIYQISPNKDTIHIDKSNWKYYKTNLNIDAFKIPFNIHSLILNIPSTNFKVEKISNGFISGTINLNNMKASLDSTILKFKYDNIKLNGLNSKLHITYDKKFKIFSKNTISFTAGDLDVNLRDAAIELDANKLYIIDTYLSVNNLLYTKINSIYNKDTAVNTLILDHLLIKKDTNIVYKKNNLILNIKQANNITSINADEIKTQLILDKERWKLKIGSLNKMEKDSPILQNLKIDEGHLLVTQEHNKSKINIQATIQYDYKLLMINNKAIKEYKINGSIDNSVTKLNINDRVNIKIANDIDINMKDCGLNVSEFMRFKDDIKLNIKKKSKQRTLMHAKNFYFYIEKDRKIISDNIELQHNDTLTTAKLEYKKGSANLKIENNKFDLYGNDFNDKFMENIFVLSKFHGGDLDFFLKGTFDKYSGTINIKNTTLLHYKILNNVLAFINTIPSLLTFSLPGYNKKGLKIQSAYGKFNVDNGEFNLSDFLVDSKEIDITGRGIANIKKDYINMDLNLKTDLGSNMKNIPIVGYILLDKDSVSTSIKISGKLSDPDVKSLLAKDIATAPLNIIKRTVLLPFKVIKNIFKDNSK